MSDPRPLADLALGTRCIHAGHRPRPDRPGLVLPIDRSSAFLLDERAYQLRAEGRSEEALVYARENSPSVAPVEAKLAALDGAGGAALFASGLAALHALVLATFDGGGVVALAEQVYGGTEKLLRDLAPRLGLEVLPFRAHEPPTLDPALSRGARLVLCESIANPTLEVARVDGLADRCRAAGAVLAVDATFATPCAQRPLARGADLVWHSATKYLGGHSDLLGGVVCGDPLVLAPVRGWRTRAGAAPDAHAAFLLDRGLKTLALRMRAHSENASRLAARLAARDDVERVLHPSLDPATADQLDLPGGMLSFVVEGGDARAGRLARELSLFHEAGTLGGVESVVSLPRRMSHSHLTEERRVALGIVPGFVRLSVGVEDGADLERDLAAALDATR